MSTGAVAGGAGMSKGSEGLHTSSWNSCSQQACRFGGRQLRVHPTNQLCTCVSTSKNSHQLASRRLQVWAGLLGAQGNHVGTWRYLQVEGLWDEHECCIFGVSSWTSWQGGDLWDASGGCGPCWSAGWTEVTLVLKGFVSVHVFVNPEGVT